MRFLIDQPLSWRLADQLSEAGHDAVHVRDRGMAQAADQEILELATAEERIIVTQDCDFGALLARSGSSRPSLILYRRQDARPVGQVRLLLDNLDELKIDLEAGAIVVFDDASVRVRRLPSRG